MTFSERQVDSITDKNHHSVKLNRIRTQNEICFDMWAGIRGPVVTLPGQASSRISHLYYGITDGFYYPLYFFELDYGTFNKMKDNHIDYMEYCDHFIDFSEVTLVHGNVADAPPALVEDLDFCCAPHTVGKLILSRLKNQEEAYVESKGFSFTIYELPGTQADSIRLINNVIRYLGGATLISAQTVALSGIRNDQHVVMIDGDYNRSPEPKSFCYKYQPPISANMMGKIEAARWFRFRDRSGGYISNTFAVRYT